MKNIRSGLLAGLGAVAIAAAVSPAHASAQQEKDRAATVTVNNSWSVPVVVYLDHGPFDTRLGTVAPHAKATLALPKNLDEGEDVRVFVHPEGQGDLASQDVTVRRGQNIGVYVPAKDADYVPPPPETTPDPGPGTTTVTVQNPRARDVVVFIAHGAFDTRIGTVPADQEKTLAIPAFLTRERESVEILLHPEGEADLSSRTFDLNTGAHLFVKVPER